MNFIRRVGRNEIYIKYVHQLVNALRHRTTPPRAKPLPTEVPVRCCECPCMSASRFFFCSFADCPPSRIRKKSIYLGLT